MSKIADCPTSLLTRIRRAHPAQTARRAAPIGEIAKGSRNATLFGIGCSHRGNGVGAEARLQILLRENANRCESPLAEAEVRSIAASVMRYDPEPVLTDLYVARRVFDKHGSDIRYDHARKLWYVWTGSHWMEDRTGALKRLVKGVLDEMMQETASIEDAKARQQARKAVGRLQSKPRLEGALGLLESEPTIPISAADFDKATMLLNAPNCVIDLSSGAAREHNRGDYMTRMCGGVYVPTAICPRFIDFLRRIFGDNQELIDFIQVIIGYALTGETSEQCLFLFHGAGANGKSVLLSVIRTILASYAMNASTETFLRKPGGRSASNDLARLNGARFVTAIESDDGRKLDEAVIKAMTGGDLITARFLFAEYVEFKPQAKVFFATNHRPIMNGGDAALWRRVHLIPFNVIIPIEQRQRNFDQILLEEREGILAWAVQGAVKWHTHGLKVPECVRSATESYRRELDHVGAFIADMCEQAPNFEEPASDLHAAYTAWAIGNDRPMMNQQEFGKQLGLRGIDPVRRGGKVWRSGVRLRSKKLRLVEAA